MFDGLTKWFSLYFLVGFGRNFCPKSDKIYKDMTKSANYKYLYFLQIIEIEEVSKSRGINS
jgi:hypothetical protein